MCCNTLKGFVLAFLLAIPIGCQPNRAVDDPANDDNGAAIDNVPPIEQNPESSVDVQVGGGEGVQVEVQPDGPNDDGVEVQVGGDSN